MKICFVTPDVLGPIKNGGVGTATAYLAHLAKQLGHEVSILFSVEREWLSDDVSEWQEIYGQNGIELIMLEDVSAPLSTLTFWPGDEAKTSYLIWKFLDARHFDLAMFADWKGQLYFSGMEKKLGERLGRTRLVTICHSTQLWSLDGGDSPIRDARELRTVWLERRSVALSDTVIVFNDYMRDYMRDRHFEMPPDVRTLSNYYEPDGAFSEAMRRGLRKDKASKIFKRQLVSAPTTPTLHRSTDKVHGVRGMEVNFFGRLEARKGVPLFCDALDRIAKEMPDGRRDRLSIRKVNFFGRVGTIDGIDAVSYILWRSRKWPFPIDLITDLGQQEALAALKASGGIVVVPSQADNSPLVVIESLAHGLCVAVADAGGMPALIAKEFHPTHVFAPHPKALVHTLTSLARAGLPAARAANDQQSIREQWTRFFREVDEAQQSSPPPATPNLPASVTEDDLTVVVLHRNRHDLLRQALAGLRQQDMRGFGLVVVDDGSDDPDTLAELPSIEASIKSIGGRLLHTDDVWLGAARNTAVKTIRSKYILFVDDDNVAMPNHVSSLMRRLHTSGADIVTCASIHFSGRGYPSSLVNASAVQVPLGKCSPLDALDNYVGDANFIVKRSVYEAIGGFRELVAVGSEDWDFLLRALKADYSIAPLAEATYFKRVNAESVVNRMRRQATHVRPMYVARDLADKAAASEAINFLHALNSERWYAAVRDEWYAQHGHIASMIGETTGRVHASTDFARAEIALAGYYFGQPDAVRRAAEVMAISPIELYEIECCASVFALGPILIGPDIFAQMWSLSPKTTNSRSVAAAARDILRLCSFSATNQQCTEEGVLLSLARHCADDTVAEIPIWLGYTGVFAALFRGEAWLAGALADQVLRHIDGLYELKHQDIAEAVHQTKFFRRGSDHYTNHGQAENRWIHCFRMIRLIPREVISMLKASLAAVASREEDDLIRGGILRSLDEADDVLLLSSLAAIARRFSERYMIKYSDIPQAIPEFFSSPLHHYLAYGRAERRFIDEGIEMAGAPIVDQLDDGFWQTTKLGSSLDRSGWSGPRWIRALRQVGVAMRAHRALGA